LPEVNSWFWSAGPECRVAYGGSALAVCGLCPIRPVCPVRLARLMR
jgi:hypothetical protein